MRATKIGSFLKQLYPFYVGNKAVTKSGSVLPVVDKFNGNHATQFSVPDDSDVEAAIVAGVKAEKSMKALTSFQRKDILLELASNIKKREEEFVYALCLEAGKPFNDSTTEVARAIDTITTSAEESVRNYGEYASLDISTRNKGFQGITRRYPLGLVSMISPFNFPLNLVAHKVAPAIAAGCPFILKPSEKTPLGSLLLAEELSKMSALPEGAFSVLPCDTKHAAPLSKDDRIKALSFTGSETVGWKLKDEAGAKKVILELGGNAAVIVDETHTTDKELDHIASRIVFGAFYYSGQSCISVQRVLLHESVYDKVKALLVTKAKALKSGDPMDKSTFIGPIISEHDAKRLEKWVGNAVNKGAQVLLGGKRNGVFFEPTILENVGRDTELFCDEAFGPVCWIGKFKSWEQALEQVNDSRFGLQAGVFTKNIHRAFNAFDELEVGGVVINDIPSVRVDSQPYGGVKRSGVGREGIRFAIEDFSETKIMLLKDIGTNLN